MVGEGSLCFDTAAVKFDPDRTVLNLIRLARQFQNIGAGAGLQRDSRIVAGGRASTGKRQAPYATLMPYRCLSGVVRHPAIDASRPSCAPGIVDGATTLGRR